MKYKDRELRSIADLLSALKDQGIRDQPVWFRGHEDIDWKLIPSVARGQNAVDAEFALIKRFKQNALPFLTTRPTSDWDWLFLMQHHGVPTRLLDWSESPLVALYFTVSEEKCSDKDGVLWSLLPKVLNEHAHYRPEHSLELPFFGVDNFLDNYLPEKIAQERSSNLNPVAAISVRESRRMYAQLGVFTIIHREAIPIPEVGNADHVWRFIIPRELKSEILAELSYLSVNRLALFPELASVANVAKEIMR